MKKQTLVILGFTALFGISSCGNSTEENSSTENHNSTETESENPEGTAETMMDKSIIDPQNFDFNQVVSAADLYKSMMLLNGKEIKMVVYPSFMYEGATLGKSCYAGSAPGSCSNSADCNLSVDFKESHELALQQDMALLIKGKVGLSGFGNTLNISDAEIIEGADMPEAEDFNPQSFNQEMVYNPQGILDFFVAWGGKNATVSGDFLGTTISKSVDGKELYEAKIELGSWEQKVKCTFGTEAEAQAFSAGEGVVEINGTLSAESDYYGYPILENSVRVK